MSCSRCGGGRRLLGDMAHCGVHGRCKLGQRIPIRKLGLIVDFFCRIQVLQTSMPAAHTASSRIRLARGSITAMH